MYRSVSLSRVSDDYFMPTALKTLPGMRTPSAMEVNEQAVDSVDEMAKKERSRIKFAENAVHFIPLVLLICAFILWLFSNPNVDVGIKATDSVAAGRIEGLTIEGDIDTDSDGTQTSILPVELRDLDKPSPKLPKRAFRRSFNRFN